MEYTVKQLADLAGTTPRTLRWYDKEGLLSPARVTGAGYRVYGPAQVDRLQQILFYRELGLELSAIRALLDSPDYNRQAALQSHLTELEGRRARLDALILTVRKTIASETGGNSMSDQEKFECFKQNMIRENEEKHGAEVRSRYGGDLMDQANARIAGLTKEEYWAMTALEDQIRCKLTAAVRAGADPAGEAGLDLAMLHKTWLSYSWDQKQYSPQAHRGLAGLYVGDERFTAYYDKEVPGCARFLHDAILAHMM